MIQALWRGHKARQRRKKILEMRKRRKMLKELENKKKEKCAIFIQSHFRRRKAKRKYELLIYV